MKPFNALTSVDLAVPVVRMAKRHTTHLGAMSLLLVALACDDSSASSSGVGAAAATGTGATGAGATGGTGAGGAGGAGGGGAMPEALGTVDVYLAAGDLDATDRCFFGGDLFSDSGGCSIHRLRIDLTNGQQLEHELAIEDDPQDGKGVWQASVSRDGSQIAFTHNDQKTSVSVRVKPLPSSQANELGTAIVSTPPGVFVFANWNAADNLTMSRADGEPACYLTEGPDAGTCTTVERWNNVYLADPSGSTNPQLVAGTAGFSFQDTFAHPTNANLIAGHGKLNAANLQTYPSCTNGNAPPASLACSDMRVSPQPVIIDLDSGEVVALALHSDEAKYPGLALEGCAHLAWSPDGDQILCTEQGTAEMKAVGEQGRIFVFEMSEATLPAANEITSLTATPLFDHRLADEIWTLEGDDQCDVFHHKYAEWCGVNGFVVATIGCVCETTACQAEAGGEPKVVGDRVFLLDVRAPADPKYHDLTTQLEQATGNESYSMTSFTATCANYAAAD